MDDQEDGAGIGTLIVLFVSICMTTSVAAWFILG